MMLSKANGAAAPGCEIVSGVTLSGVLTKVTRLNDDSAPPFETSRVLSNTALSTARPATVSVCPLPVIAVAWDSASSPEANTSCAKVSCEALAFRFWKCDCPAPGWLNVMAPAEPTSATVCVPLAAKLVGLTPCVNDPLTCIKPALNTPPLDPFSTKSPPLSVPPVWCSRPLFTLTNAAVTFAPAETSKSPPFTASSPAILVLPVANAAPAPVT